MAPKNEGGCAKRLTYSQQRILGRIAELSVFDGVARCTKNDIAHAVGCSEKTVDRAIVRFRKEGLVEVIACHDNNGAQVGNAYRIVQHQGGQ
ncbi:MULTISPECIES: helix-turn-helix domain-containing protein [unclassified Adlercreutzia]|uniref:helix-turn-helix domain-containing protein n=1 Tax=unclassified Adlercreutzia TaxID=2636013 RepID=UPI0013ECA031|nr:MULTISPECIES: helix-turn-helix domain-containing protein [unclassified Adlercreutzia]